jgi:hypothetical protein
MSPTQDYLHGRFADALACWGEELAAGRAWSEIEDEIVRCCEGRVDLLTALLVEAETLRAGMPGAPRRPSSVCTPRRGVPHPRHHLAPASERMQGSGGFACWS